MFKRDQNWAELAIQQCASELGCVFDDERGHSNWPRQRAFQRWFSLRKEVLDATPRYHACVKADQECVDAVLNSGLAPEKYDRYGVV
jgi:hypothetical protein